MSEILRFSLGKDRQIDLMEEYYSNFDRGEDAHRMVNEFMRANGGSEKYKVFLGPEGVFVYLKEKFKEDWLYRINPENLKFKERV